MADTLPRPDDLEATWNFVEPGIHQILGRDGTPSSALKRVDKVLSPAMYMEVYTAIYNYCVNKSSSAGQFNTDNSRQNQSSLLVGGEIYQKLQNCLQEYLSNLERSPNEGFLHFYVRRWKRFTVGAIFLNHAFDYMNRYWVQKERSDGKRHIFDINTLCLMTWKEVMFDQNVDQLVQEVLQIITLQRDGCAISHTDTNVAIRSFVALGIDPQDLKKLNLNVYIQHFEKPFLEYTRAYYKRFSTQYLENRSVAEYIFAAQEKIKDEETKIVLYLDEHTKKLLSEALNAVLITDHSQALEGEFVALLDSREESKISTLYNLMQRDILLLPKLAQAYEEYVKKTGEQEISSLITEHKAKLSDSMDEQAPLKKSAMNFIIPPNEYVRKLIEVYETFVKITRDCFQNGPLFTKALDNACRAYINVNELAIPLGSPKSATSKTPEMLAKYSDQLLKRSTRATDSNSELSADDIMTIFKFLTDKDAFETHYRRLFAKRLIHGTSTSEEDEEAVIQRLQSENSMEYTGKITKMLQDIRLSKQLEKEFESAIKITPDYSRSKYPDFQPFVLAETMWPFSFQDVDFNLPEELIPTHTGLEKLYTNKHSGRVLKWLWPLCRGEMVADIGKPGKAPFVFTVTLFQMTILLLFNEKSTLTLEEIQEHTNISTSNIASSMIPFIRWKLVQQSPPGLDALAKPDTVFKLSTPYKALKTKINFAAGVKSEVPGLAGGNGKGAEITEVQKIEKELNTERQIFLEACIVRIMKARRKLPHATLVNECIAQSHQRFNAKVSLIKRAIDNLIAKEYLQRCDDGESYEYLA
ncbi:LANO_0E02454g1_1 [Lachancea nothofagi CBS 11611]|uniref:LANO_0E02454g1_1 n=1 Tax=Lachancea nothofagi CBS 11611 TaxID=1266666 RepID=A0A1G4JQ24_9SACH|nr:LANO_0E02454g1_1 [Lachancea nothofagi CBS 11611]